MNGMLDYCYRLRNSCLTNLMMGLWKTPDNCFYHKPSSSVIKHNEGQCEL